MRAESKIGSLLQKIIGLLFIFFYPFILFIPNASGIVVPDGYYIACTEEFIRIDPINFDSTSKGSWRYTSVSDYIHSFNNFYRMPVLMPVDNSWIYRYDLNAEFMTSYRRVKFKRIIDGSVLISIVVGSRGWRVEKGIAQDTKNHIYLHDKDWADRCTALDIREPFPGPNLGVADDVCM